MMKALFSRLRGRRIPVFVRVLVPVIVIALVWTLADADDALARLGAVSWGWIALAFLALNLQIVLSALRWRMVSQSLGVPLSRRDSVAEYYLAQLVNQTVPGGVVGDAARAVRARHAAGLGRATQGVVIERMAGQIALWSVLTIGLVVSLVMPGGIVWPVEPGLIGLMGFAVLAPVGLYFLLRGGRTGVLARFGEAVKLALIAPELRWKQIGISLAIVACNLLGFAFAAEATATTLSAEAVVTLVPLILTAMLIPATVAGWGFREGAAAALFPLAGASAAAGLAASLAFGLVVLAASLPGVFVILRRRRVPVATG
ncbi:flippase-like domain-containing protein [Arsenicitalea aurantiaca]|uniref:Flippase-like domain-containing protein n=1 Tax=Arsenicitalea aurantiaca TaxID=1783274 RepID=A0A433X3C8_9HYPH|nr:lysylphosphatidylglycerol synthase transmembrane domain-containing protein [Arsenicitalea aurantiaca]RUT28569.1 flippase-like domain-containing protein [Arsenicitalea aurantiaca]